jgi:branched-chain amino acid transport system permease protein
MARLQIRWWLALGAAALASAVVARDPYTISVINLVAIAALTASSLRFVMLIGELNFATAAFVGIGAYGAGAATTVLQWPFVASLLVGGLVAALVSVVFGAITLRTRGPYFLLIGFAFTEAARIIYSKTAVLGGTSGMIGIFPPRALDRWMPLLVMAVVLVLIFVLFVIERSDLGKVFVAIRDNENVVKTVGIDVLFIRVLNFTIASLCAGMAGSLHAFVNNVISPGDFSFLLASFALAYVKVGGESSAAGPIAGSVLLVLLGSYALGLGGSEYLFYGAAIILALMLMPDGMTGLFGKISRKIGARKAAAAPDAEVPPESHQPAKRHVR